MLKIRDDIDLKELEKFGFYQSNEPLNCWDYELLFNEEYNFCYETPYGILSVKDFTLDENGKLIKLKDRILDLTIIQDDECSYNFDIIFDIIQSGLVEKVVEQ